jgi:hypothetical protein
VLLVASDDYNSIPRLASILHRAGCRVIFLGPEHCWLAATGYISKRILLPVKSQLRPINIDRRTAWAQAILAALSAHLRDRRETYDWILPIDDALIAALWSDRNEPWVRACLPPYPGRTEVANLLLSKITFMRAMQRANVLIPRFEVVADVSEAVHAAESVGYPVIVKPDIGTGGRDVWRADSAEDIRAASARFVSGKPVILQKFLPWRLGVTEALFDHGKPVSWISSYTPRSCARFGPSISRIMMTHPATERILEIIGRETYFHGFGGFDFLHDQASNDLAVLEMHARATAGLHLGPQCEVDFVTALREMLAGKQSVHRPTLASNASRELPLFPQDLEFALEHHDWPTVVRWFSGRSGCVDIPWDDLALIRAYVRRTCRREAKWILSRAAAHLCRPGRLRQLVGRAIPNRQVNHGADFEADLVGLGRT